MNDTPDHVRHLYAKFIMGKSDVERFKIGFEMADTGQRIVEQRFQEQHPDWSIAEIKAAVFERICRDDFSPAEMAHIKASLLTSHQQMI